VLHVLDTVEATAHAIPPVENAASRFGNPAFRTFYDRVSEVRSACINSSRIVEQVRACSSPHRYMRRFQFRPTPGTKLARISSRRGEIARESTTGAAWSSIFCVGCASFLVKLSLTYDVHL
jgi:hypothetical protein